MNIEFDLVEYMNKSIRELIGNALKACFKNPREAAYILKFIKSVEKSNQIREKLEEQGRHIPPFLIASITSRCNLFCKGCYARENKICAEEKVQLSVHHWSQIFKEAEEIGVSFILLAGGEPFMRPDILERAAEVRNILFPVFTNGTLIDEEKIKWLDGHRNILPVLSIEGSKGHTDKRRGNGTYDKLKDAMRMMQEKQIFYGASITVTTENLCEITGEDFIRDLYSNDCRIVFYVEYVPVSKDTQTLAPTDRERAYLDFSINLLRKKYEGIIFLSFPGDEKSSGGCLAAGRGFFHINPEGNAEPCPFSPYSDTNLQKTGLLEALNSPLFQRLNQSGIMNQDHTGGCVLFSRRDQVTEML
jgi:MoaA/NifB/PqqE/SkfB family radical SAM enzyme